MTAVLEHYTGMIGVQKLHYTDDKCTVLRVHHPMYMTAVPEQKNLLTYKTLHWLRSIYFLAVMMMVLN